MPIITNNTESVKEPELEYNRLGIYLAVSPVWKEDDVSGSVSLRLVPYRKLSDNTIEKLETKTRDVFVADVSQKAVEDPEFATAFNTILEALQTYITTKGL